MNALQIVCLIIISGCTVALIGTTIITVYQTIKPGRKTRCRECKYNPANPRRWNDPDDIMTFVWCEAIRNESRGEGYCHRGKPTGLKKKILDARDAQGDWLEKKNESKEVRP